MFSVNCSHLNFDRLPSFVPENTTIFLATDNKVHMTVTCHLHFSNIKILFEQITSLEPLKTTFRHVEDIYLDYNHIQSIDILESDRGTEDWLQTFRILSLKGNRLTKVFLCFDYLFNRTLNKNKNIIPLAARVHC